MPQNPLLELGRLLSEGLHSKVRQVEQHFKSQRQTPKEESRLSDPPPLISASSHVTKESLGRSTWLLLHTMAAQYPDRPDKSQQKDVRNLIEALSRTYPCADCSAHFREIIRKKPPQTATSQDLQLWMCEVHNLVNDSLGKPSFNCSLVGMRWQGCDETDGGACAIGNRGLTKR